MTCFVGWLVHHCKLNYHPFLTVDMALVSLSKLRLSSVVTGTYPAILYEAKRCVAGRLPSLRPFQRKAAFMGQAFALLDSLDFLYPHQKAEILWRTASSKEQLDAEVAWKRAKCVEKELDDLAEKVKTFVPQAKTHNEAVNMLVQSLYEQLTGFVGKPVPHHWEHAHNHCVLAFRLYYRFENLDPDFPAPISPRDVIIPLERPKTSTKTNVKINMNSSSSISGKPDNTVDASLTEPHIDVAELFGEDRRKMLQEVREHLELLKEFEGVVSEEEIAKRKRELFAALPPAPSAVMVPSPAKKRKLEATSDSDA